MNADASYPRPLMQRSSWTSLDGSWDFALDPGNEWSEPSHVEWDRRILVPFAPETPASGVEAKGLFNACWYRRQFHCERPQDDRVVVLHFGAVDYEARVWLNGAAVGHHEGGYTPFEIDVTPCLDDSGTQELVVQAIDDPHDLAKPRGKQDWQPEPHMIWYPRTTGIWQTVWYEVVPRRRMTLLQWIPDMARWEVRFEMFVAGAGDAGLRLRVKLEHGGRVLADDCFGVVNGEVARGIAIADPGIDDFRNELLWHPERPTLIDAHLELIAPDDSVVDEVHSYTALRSVNIEGDVILLNGRPMQMRLLLDQGVWPESGMTPPDDRAFERDIQLVKAMGFNGVRMHQKVEDPRFLAAADRMGLMVWAEMPSAYRFTRTAVRRLLHQWHDVIIRDLSHPCIVTWVPFNESWGVPDLPGIAAQRDFIRAIYHLTRTLDPSRPVSGNDGWESTATDIIGVHDYDQAPQRLAKRYETHEVLPQLIERERPAGRRLVLEGPGTHPIVLSEFGGMAFDGRDDGSPMHGYWVADSAEQFGTQVLDLLEQVRELPLLAGFCYTQFTDTYQEKNGLLYADRTPKIPLEKIAAATMRAPRWLEQDV
jgi:Glycosyl hydrolases family 2, TIM barrel domain/Glycosyl hydrolases family 2, sugar binding domain